MEKYNDISLTSEAISESIKRKPDLNNLNNNQIEIRNINIEKNQMLFNNNINYNNYFNQKNKDDNSLSEGEERTNPLESSESDMNNYKKNNKYNTANNFMPNYGNKNQTGKDLLMLKYFNENFPENNINNNINNNIDDEEGINPNNNLLQKKEFYNSGEYNLFKNQFIEKMNNNKTLTNFGSVTNPHNLNILSDDIQNLKIIKHDEKEIDEIKNKIELLKLKNEDDNMEDNNYSNNIDNINNHKNNKINIFNNNIELNDEGNSSPGEVRSEDSY